MSKFSIGDLSLTTMSTIEREGVFANDVTGLPPQAGKMMAEVKPGFAANDDAILEDEVQDTSFELDRKIRQSLYMPARLLERELDNGNVSGRTRHAMLHVALSDARISRVEDQLSELMRIIYNEPPKTRRQKGSDTPVYRHVLHRSRPGEFLVNAQTFLVPHEDLPAVEVLVSGQAAMSSRGSDEFSMPPRRSTGLLPSDEKNHQIPERLRIRSFALLTVFDRISRGQAPSSSVSTSETDGKMYNQSLIHLRPFKFFISYEQELRRVIQQLVPASRPPQQESDIKGVPTRRGSVFEFPRDFNDEEKDYLRIEMQCLQEFMDVDLKPMFNLRQTIANGTATHIDYQDLWHLFERGDYVVSLSNPENAFRVISFTGGRDPLVSFIPGIPGKENITPVEGFVLDCYSLVFDGTHYVPKLHKFSIRRFLGQLPISSLAAFPLRFHPDSETLRSRFFKQGEAFIELAKRPYSHLLFTGKTLDEPAHDIDAPVIIDMAMAVSAVPEWRPKSTITEDDLTKCDVRETNMPPYCTHRGSEGCCGSDIGYKDLELDEYAQRAHLRENARMLSPRRLEELHDEEFMLLPHWVPAFVLRSRKWVTLRAVDLVPVTFENDFNELMLPPSHKRTVLALVQNHENARTKLETQAPSIGTALDFVKGKGSGLIILLHGEPGVGKTSTAECVADTTQRPLFPITCGDLGETAMDVEEKLHRNFQMAQKWGCVLLLDEADVFLAKRNKTDLRRNAVTSVFLRSLEYYAGILFLTTNRVGGIDPAFKSRIHVSLYYPRLDLHSTLSLHKLFIARTKEQQKQFNSHLFQINEGQILRFAERHFKRLQKSNFPTWNGRQIRNAFQTAIALAENEARANPGVPIVLGKEQFKTVAEGAQEFEEYLIKTLGAPESDIAFREEWRANPATSSMVAVDSAAGKISYRPTQGAKNLKDPESDDDTELSSEDEDDDQSEEEGRHKKGDREGFTSPFMDEFMEFMRMKEAQSKSKGRK
ncbi:hypothetical protein BX600DRAFT_111809 [Xylariales sp. PMI_506]|nr:hypothetical protein BX600DRAFT_111809 [Xylariales sp. PMI_506]